MMNHDEYSRIDEAEQNEVRSDMSLRSVSSRSMHTCVCDANTHLHLLVFALLPTSLSRTPSGRLMNCTSRD